MNTYTVYGQGEPSVATDASGNFVVSWTGRTGPYLDLIDIFGQRFDSAGNRVGTDFQVNTYTLNLQRDSAVASDAGGNFVVTWRSYLQDGSGTGVFGRRFDSGGAAVGSEFMVNTYTIGTQYYSRVASDANGNFVVVWNSFLQDGSGYLGGIFGQRFDSSGTFLGGEFQINTYTAYSQFLPDAAMDPSGNFVVVWSSEQQDGVGIGETGVFAQRFDSGGAAVDTEFQVNTATFGPQQLASVAIHASSNFVVVWTGPQLANFDVFGQLFSSTGSRIGPEFQANTFMPGPQWVPSVDMSSTGDFVAVWRSGDTSYTQDGSFGGIFAQRYSAAILTATPTLTPTITPTSTITPTVTPSLTPTPAQASCAATPVGGCATPGKAIVKMQDKGSDNKKLLWKWANGTINPGAFGDPVASTSYRLCVYDDGALVMNPLVEPGSLWQATSKGFKYSVPGATNAAGIFKVLLKQGAGNAKLLMKGRGAPLALPFPGGITQSSDVTVQLVKDALSGSECWQSVFTPPNGGSDSEKFKDKLP